MKVTGDSRILQFHPTLQCNLKCSHCYSASSPHHLSSLDVELLCRVISEAATEGYNTVSVSGGEPLLYNGLYRLLDCAKSLGMRTAITTNGMLLSTNRLEMLKGVVDLIAISLDGTPESHNHNRGSKTAFQIMSSHLERLKVSDITFGFIFTLTRHNLHELDWVAKFSLAQGARLLQIHPLEYVGRANETRSQEKPDAMELAFAYLEAARIQQLVGDQMFVQIDFATQEAIRNKLKFVNQDLIREGVYPLLSEVLSPLVVESDGTLVPLQYGFSRAYALGDIQNATIHELSLAWFRETLHAFQRIYDRAFRRMDDFQKLPFFNWYELLMEVSHDFPNERCEALAEG